MKRTNARSSKRQWLGTITPRRKRFACPLIATTIALTSAAIRADTVLTDTFSANAPGVWSPVALTTTDLAATRSLVVTLKMRNLAELQERVGTGKRATDAEMKERYLPLDADYRAVADWLKSQGLTVKPKGADQESISVSGSIAQLQAALKIAFGRVDVDGKTYVSTFNAPTVPDALAPTIIAIHGLQPEVLYHAHTGPGIAPHDPPPNPDDPPTPTTAPANPPQDTRTPSSPPPNDVMVSGGGAATNSAQSNYGPAYKIGDIQNAYKATNLNLDGTGQTIAIIIDDYPEQSDLNMFWQQNGLGQTAPGFTPVYVEGSPIPHGADQAEATLDVSWASGIAPGAKILLYEIPSLRSDYITDAYNRIISDIAGGTKINIVSLSYGANEGYDYGNVASDNTMMTQIANGTDANGGVTVFVSSGDGGSNPGLNGGYASNNILAPETPASATNVVAVGGTTLKVAGNGSDAVSSEIGWSPQTYAGGRVLASGGGISGSGAGKRNSYQPNPQGSWQANYPNIPASTRCVPDISLAADPNYGAILYLNGTQQQYGGTSWSAPTWAGFCAQINQARVNSGSSTLGGSLTSLLYTTLAPVDGLVRDINQGSNGAYNAKAGYDLVTGLGVPNDLARIAHTLAAPFFTNEVDKGSSFYFLNLPNGNLFGYYSVRGPDNTYTFPLIYHQDMGYEYIFNANDQGNGIYMYDFTSQHFFYTSQTFPFPYLYDFSLQAVLYYYPDSNTTEPDYQERYSHNPRYFYNFSTGNIFTQ